jgi:hypothetical protein
MEENKKDVLPLEGEPLTTPQISEPVVNALAAALSKIETYVPTQYINDGPPDIDAEHLNHAEQAIMRVTNLANGAADAISALQSQVTQLNNNLTPSVYIVPRPSNIADIDSITIWGVWAVKNGKTVYLQFNFDGTMVAGTEWKILFTLPQTYCPSVGTVIVNYNTQKGKPMIITIETNGRVKIICSSGEAIPEGDWICRQCITYVTEA